MSGKFDQRYVIGGGALILMIVAVPLVFEFSEPANLPWNLFLSIFLIGLSAAAVMLQRYFIAHADEIGEARFDTTNKDNG